MEKVVAVSGSGRLYDYDMYDVNSYLDQGWTVKSISSIVSDEYVTAIFALEKK